MNILLSTIGRRGYIADFLRSSLNREDQIFGTSNSKWTSGLLHCDKGFLVPDIKSEEYIPSVLDICKKNRVEILISLFDPDIRKLAAHIKEFDKLHIFHLIPDKSVVEICFDKIQTYNFLKKNKFFTPKTFSEIENVKKELNNKKINFPLIIKPRYGYGSRNIFVADNYNQLEVFFSLEKDMIIQEYLDGEELHLDIFNDKEGNIISVIPKKKITMRSGETDKAYVFKDKKLLNFSIELSSRLKHTGNLDIDLFLNENKFYILEMNTRFGGGYPLCHFAGADMLDLVVKMGKGKKIIPVINQFKDGVYFMKEPGFVKGEIKDLSDKYT